MQAEKCDRNWDDLFFLNFLIYNMSTTNLISFLRIFFFYRPIIPFQLTFWICTNGNTIVTSRQSQVDWKKKKKNWGYEKYKC